jgi:hypothetical protein
VEIGIHIGEYILMKLAETGRTQTWLARQLNTSRQNLKNYTDKPELKPSVVKRIIEAVGDPHFFDDFFQKNPELGKLNFEEKLLAPAYLESRVRGQGFRIRIEIEPSNFDAPAFSQSLDELNDELVERMLAEYRRISKKD